METRDWLFLHIWIAVCKHEKRSQLIRTRPTFYIFIDNPNVNLGIVDYAHYTRRFALKDDYHKKRLDMLAYIPVEFN